MLTVIYSVAHALRGEEFVIGEGATIGRVGDHQINLPDREVSRQHARISVQGGQYYIEDLGSLNGTWVNGERIAPNHPIPLISGCEIRLGPQARLLFSEAGATIPASTALHELYSSLPVGEAIGEYRLSINQQRREVWLGGQRLEPPLSPVQYALLALLASAPGRVFSRDDIATAIWPDYDRTGVSDEAIDAVVKRLRERLAPLAPDWQIIITVRGHGFKLGE